MQTIDEITNYLKNNLTEKRFAHTMGVAETAQSLAEVWGADGSRAFLAGLVHDCAKELSFDKTIEILTENGYSQDDANQDFPMLFHAPCGAILARKIFGIEDADFTNIDTGNFCGVCVPLYPQSEYGQSRAGESAHDDRFPVSLSFESALPNGAKRRLLCLASEPLPQPLYPHREEEHRQDFFRMDCDHHHF